MRKLGFVYKLYVFNWLVSFLKHTLLLWHGWLMTQRVKAILLITQNSHLSYFLILLIKTVSFTFYSAKKKKRRERLKAKDKDKNFDFMNVLLASKNLKTIWKYDKCPYVLFLRMMFFKTIPLFGQTWENSTFCVFNLNF